MNVMFAFLNTIEVVAIVVLVVLLFGVRKLPALAKGLGQSIKEFKKAAHEEPGQAEATPPPEKKS
jgi:sec-independent protein translocase protein TatA